jgi:hypothetical protein
MNIIKLIFTGVVILGSPFWGYSHQVDPAAEFIEVPVRVFNKDQVVDNLTLQDFKVYENGSIQKVESLYYIHDHQIARSEGSIQFVPKITKDFYLLFEISKVNIRLKNVIKYFINYMLMPGDSLTIISPKNTYRMKSNALRVLNTEEIERQVIRILNRDSLLQRTDYRNALNEIMKMTEILENRKNIDPSQNIDSSYAASFFEGFNLERYSYFLETLANMRRVDEAKLLNLAKDLKMVEGEKNVFFLYQRDSIPYLKPRFLDQYIRINPEKPDLTHRITYLANFFQRDLAFNVDRLKRSFADSSITLDFFLFTKPLRAFDNLYVIKNPDDILMAFNEITKATGGTSDCFLDPQNSVRAARTALQSYYLLYYSSERSGEDRKFNRLEIKTDISGKNYQIYHRAGYFKY